MGVCTSSDQTRDPIVSKRNKQIGKSLDKKRAEDETSFKLLLLGAGESGKSTLFKQMINLYGCGFSHEDLMGYTPIIHNNIILGIKTLIEESEALSQMDCSFSMRPELNASKRIIQKLQLDARIDPELASHIKVIWEDSGIQRTFSERWRYQLSDGCCYFLDRITEIGQPAFVPDEQDILRCRVRTTGIVETEFSIDDVKFRMFDVGGQRNERKKWIHCFENVTAVIFVASLSEYDQVLYEDEETNRMREALDLFDEICNSRWFPNTSIILFLNKRDLFMEKILKVPLQTCFPDYDGAQNYEEACHYLQLQFESRNNVPTKRIYTQITCATDKDNILHVFEATKDIVVRRALEEGGLMI